MSAWSRWLFAWALGLPLWVATGPSAASAGADRRPDAEAVSATGGGWLSVHTGLTWQDAFAMDAATARQGEAPGVVFGVGAHYRLGRVDLGALVEHLASFRFRDPTERGAALERSGGQVRVAAILRWRLLEAPVGALFMSLTPGVMAFSHADAVRREAAAIGAEDEAEPPAVDAHDLGLSLGVALGGALYVSEGLAVTARLVTVVGHTTVEGGPRPVDYNLLRGHLSLGLEWRM